MIRLPVPLSCARLSAAYIPTARLQTQATNALTKPGTSSLLSILEDIQAIKVKAAEKPSATGSALGVSSSFSNTTYRLPQREAEEREKSLTPEEKCLELFAIKRPVRDRVPDFNTSVVHHRRPLGRDDELIRSIANRTRSFAPVTPYFTHVVSTRNLPISTFNLNKIARQIKGLTLSQVMEQMQFSPKRISGKVAELMELTLKDILASDKVPEQVKSEASMESLIVARAWVGKGIYETVHSETPRWGIKKFEKRWAHMNVMVMLAPAGTVKPNKGNIPGKRAEEMRNVPRIPRNVRPILPDIPIGGKKRFYDA